MKKILVMMLAVVMLLSVVAVAAELDEDTGIAGEWETADTPIPQGTSIIIKKDLVSFNANSSKVYAPAFSYIYTVTPATVSNLTITDETTDHEAANAVTAPVNAGITTGLKVISGDPGTETSAVGTLEFTNTTELNTSADGTVNSYDITLDFSGVTFPKAGVYRYQIDETLADSATYAGIAVKDGGSNTRYLDVYVDGKLAIYGYVCLTENASVTPASESKTNGFVKDSGGQDEYYTYDLVLAKKVSGDDYAKANHAFPFTVIFKNTENYTTTYTITETAEQESVGFNPAAASAPTWSGVVLARDGKAITYTGIPAGVDVDVYETNDVLGVTYLVETTVSGGTPVVDNSVSWTATAPTSAVAQSEPKTNAYESTKVTVDTEMFTEEKPGTTSKQTVDIVNTLLLISPTGVVVRVAPYVIILTAGIALLLIGRKRKSAAKD